MSVYLYRDDILGQKDIRYNNAIYSIYSDKGLSSRTPLTLKLLAVLEFLDLCHVQHLYLNKLRKGMNRIVFICGPALIFL